VRAFAFGGVANTAFPGEQGSPGRAGLRRDRGFRDLPEQPIQAEGAINKARLWLAFRFRIV
jgi:hypothetical protein